MLIHTLLLILGFVLLIKGADYFVDGASSTAQNFHVSKILIGLTIIAFGTSAPEFAISMNALQNNNTDMILGNVIGSCIFNSLLILGISAFIHPIHIKYNTIKKELPLSLLISTLLVVLFLDVKLENGSINQISRSDAFVILLFFSIFLYYIANLARQKKDEDEVPTLPLWKSVFYVIIGLIGITVGSDFVVNHAEILAKQLGLSDRVISLTIIAFGTSLPELITSITSSKKGEQQLLLGNIIGSNIFNICVVLGIPVAIYGSIVPSSFQTIDLIMLIFSSFILFLFSETSRTIQKWEGFIMIVIFFIYYLFLCFA